MSIVATSAKSVLWKMAGLALALGVSVACFAAPALADEGISTYSNDDQPFDFNFDLLSVDYSGVDTKNDTTPTYMSVTDPGGVESCYLQVQGSNDAVYWNNRASYGNVLFKPRIGQFSIHNLVYESGEGFARLGAYPDGSAGHMYGVWSGDSMYTYESLN